MDIVEKFNIKLNESSIRYKDRWENYVNSIDIEIMKTIDDITKRDCVLVIGAGNCSDIRLNTLLNNFKSVILTDIDTEAIKQGLKMQSISEKMLDRIEITKMDYTNIDYASFLDKLVFNIKAGNSIDRLKKIIDLHIIEGSSNERLGYYRNLNDLVIVSPIYSQLLLNLFTGILDQLRLEGISAELLEQIKEYLLQKMVVIIENLNNDFYKLINKEGSIIALSDIFEAAEGSEFSNKVKIALEENKIAELYKEYNEEYGFGLGDYGLYSLSEKGKTVRERWLIWPFSPERNFVVKLAVIEKFKISFNKKIN